MDLEGSYDSHVSGYSYYDEQYEKMQNFKYDLFALRREYNLLADEMIERSKEII